MTGAEIDMTTRRVRELMIRMPLTRYSCVLFSHCNGSTGPPSIRSSEGQKGRRPRPKAVDRLSRWSPRSGGESGRSPAPTVLLKAWTRDRSKDRPAIDVRGDRQAEVAEHGRGNVDNVQGPSLCDRAVRHTCTRRRLVIERAVVAGPFLHVRVDAPRRRSAERRLPGHAIAIGEPHLELGGVLDEFTGVDIVGLVDGVNHVGAC